ncbi:MAG TPA: nucleoside triphosphate pyrophosphohydrolase [Candidatus Limnocylindrales bacterium]|jgi:tetrapyrrole methylase family protein/MazG family protein
MLDALIAEARLRWGLDPAAGLVVVVAERLVATPVEPSLPQLVVPAARLRADVAGLAPAALAGRHGHHADDALATLRRLYPADHPVGRFGQADGTTVAGLTPSDLEAPLYLAPVAPVADLASPWGMPWLSARLREPDGCPWDREQTHASLRNHLLEEAYEVYDALDAGATPELAGELGDLLLQVVLHAQLAAEAGVFDMTDVWAAIASKIVRRHPHVFGDAEARTASDVNRQWERIKAGERARAADESGAGTGETAVKSALEGISRSLPALAASQEMQERAANLGYDWPSIDGVLDKVSEEVGELVEAETDAHRAEELGDLLFVLVNVGRKTGIEVEGALRAANEKFRRRFGYVERAAATDDVALRDLSFEQLDALWDAAKAAEREEAKA